MAPQQWAVPSGRKCGGHPGHCGTVRLLLPVEQVNEVVVLVPPTCRHCEQPLPETAARRRGRVWRHEVAELLPLAVRVTEYPMVARRGARCRERTRAELTAGVPRCPYGARLTAVIPLLSGRYRLSRREVQQLLQDLWIVGVSLGAVVRQEQAQTAALAPGVEEARVAIQQVAVVNLDETSWRTWPSELGEWLLLPELTAERAAGEVSVVDINVEPGGARQDFGDQGLRKRRAGPALLMQGPGPAAAPFVQRVAGRSFSYSHISRCTRSLPPFTIQRGDQ